MAKILKFDIPKIPINDYIHRNSRSHDILHVTFSFEILLTNRDKQMETSDTDESENAKHCGLCLCYDYKRRSITLLDRIDWISVTEKKCRVPHSRFQKFPDFFCPKLRIRSPWFLPWRWQSKNRKGWRNNWYKARITRCEPHLTRLVRIKSAIIFDISEWIRFPWMFENGFAGTSQASCEWLEERFEVLRCSEVLLRGNTSDTSGI